MKIKELSVDNRPRERMKLKGVESLSDAELLAVLFQSGYQGLNVLDMSHELLAKHSLSELPRLSLQELMNTRGIGEAKAMQLLACFELGRRARTTTSNGSVIKRAEDVVDLVGERMRLLDREELWTILLDNAHKVISIEKVSRGTLNSSLIHPREVFKNALKKSAQSIIVAHNHPSGSVDASQEDEQVAKVLKKTGEIIGVKMLDFLIIGNGWSRV